MFDKNLLLNHINNATNNDKLQAGTNPSLESEVNEKVGKKIRDAEVAKVPYMLIIGEKEIENATLSVRKHGEGDIGTMKIEEFSAIVEKEINSTFEKHNLKQILPLGEKFDYNFHQAMFEVDLFCFFHTICKLHICLGFQLHFQYQPSMPSMIFLLHE